jgi:hypothetical protein
MIYVVSSLSFFTRRPPSRTAFFVCLFFTILYLFLLTIILLAQAEYKVYSPIFLSTMFAISYRLSLAKNHGDDHACVVSCVFIIYPLPRNRGWTPVVTGVRTAIYAENLSCLASVVAHLWNWNISVDEIRGVKERSIGQAMLILVQT